MAHFRDALFGAFAAAAAKWIGRHIDVGPCSVLVREPTEIARRERTFQRHYSLLRRYGVFTPKQKRNRLARSEATGEEICGDVPCTDGVKPRHGCTSNTGSIWKHFVSRS